MRMSWAVRMPWWVGWVVVWGVEDDVDDIEGEGGEGGRVEIEWRWALLDEGDVRIESNRTVKSGWNVRTSFLSPLVVYSQPHLQKDARA
jgi:hypothetical protein